MINLDKLDQAIAYIEEHPEQHVQPHWFYRGDGGCGTGACLAGTLERAAQELFEAANSIAAIKRIRDEIAAGAL